MTQPQDNNRPVMAVDPFGGETDDVMHQFYNPVVGEEGVDTAVEKRKEKPTHYKVVSISLYLDDIARLDDLVKELKRRGFTKMNRSALIRFAIDTVDINKLPRQY